MDHFLPTHFDSKYPQPMLTTTTTTIPAEPFLSKIEHIALEMFKNKPISVKEAVIYAKKLIELCEEEGEEDKERGV